MNFKMAAVRSETTLFHDNGRGEKALHYACTRRFFRQS